MIRSARRPCPGRAAPPRHAGGPEMAEPTAASTGSVHCHDLAWCGNELWLVNTLFSCLCTLHSDYNFVPRWRPPFITGLAAEDRCHLNGMAADGSGPRYVTVLAPTDTPQGWR